MPSVSRHLSSIRSAETFAFIKSCLDQCDLEHDCTSILELDTFASHERSLASSEYWFEDRIPWRASGPKYRPISSILRPDLEDHSKSTPSLFSHDMKAAHIADHWYQDLVADRYSVRAFTKPRDRLIALAGIAEVYQHLTKDRYVAGLWDSSLAAGLSWVKQSRFFTGPNPTTGPRWPTWSCIFPIGRYKASNSGRRYLF